LKKPKTRDLDPYRKLVNIFLNLTCAGLQKD